MLPYHFRTVLLTLCLGGLASADVKITANYNSDGKSSDTTIYSNGVRLRYEYGKGLVLLRQCDLNRMVDVDDKAKTYLVLPTEAPGTPSADNSVTAGKEKEVVTDTPEHKDMFGYPARHLKISKTTEGKPERTETDGWYIDLKGMDVCSPAQTAVAGYPVSYTINTYGENGKLTSTVVMKVTSLVTAPLDAALFDVPRGYTESNPQSIITTGKVSSKPAGSIRIGAVAMLNQSTQTLPVNATYNQLIGQLQTAQLEVVPFPNDSPEAIQKKAKDAECDYVLYTALTSLDHPASGGKVGGFLHKAPGIGHITGGDAMEAHVAYRLFSGVGNTPVLDSSATGKTASSFDWKAAALLASNVLPMTMAAKMLGGAFNPSMMSGMLTGRGSGAAMTSMDPMMGTLTMFLRGANLAGGTANPGQNPPGADVAIAAALDQVGKAIIAQVKPPTN